MPGRTILIIEDEPLIAMMLEDFLDSLGHVVAGTADSVEDALTRIDQGGFEVAIIDVHLRGKAVWPVADRLLQEGIPFIVATGGHTEPPPPQHEAAPLLTKPYTLDSIEPAIERALSRAT